MNDLLTQRSGNDLLLSGSHTNSILLKDYYDHPSDWMLVDYSGVEQSLSEVLTNNETRRASLDRISLLEEEFTAAWRVAQIQVIGGEQLADNLFELKPIYTGITYHLNQSTNLSGDVLNHFEYAGSYSDPWLFTTLSNETITSNDEWIFLSGNDTIQRNHNSLFMDATVGNWQTYIFSDHLEIRGSAHYE
jgi:hypothetical protein